MNTPTRLAAHTLPTYLQAPCIVVTAQHGYGYLPVSVSWIPGGIRRLHQHFHYTRVSFRYEDADRTAQRTDLPPFEN